MFEVRPVNGRNLISEAQKLYDAWDGKEDPSDPSHVMALIRANNTLGEYHFNQGQALVSVLEVIIKDQEVEMRHDDRDELSCLLDDYGYREAGISIYKVAINCIKDLVMRQEDTTRRR